MKDKKIVSIYLDYLALVVGSETIRVEIPKGQLNSYLPFKTATKVIIFWVIFKVSRVFPTEAELWKQIILRFQNCIVESFNHFYGYCGGVNVLLYVHVRIDSRFSYFIASYLVVGTYPSMYLRYCIINEHDAYLRNIFIRFSRSFIATRPVKNILRETLIAHISIPVSDMAGAPYVLYLGTYIRIELWTVKSIKY